MGHLKVRSWRLLQPHVSHDAENRANSSVVKIWERWISSLGNDEYLGNLVWYQDGISSDICPCMPREFEEGKIAPFHTMSRSKRNLIHHG